MRAPRSASASWRSRASLRSVRYWSRAAARSPLRKVFEAARASGGNSATWGARSRQARMEVREEQKTRKRTARCPIRSLFSRLVERRGDEVGIFLDPALEGQEVVVAAAAVAGIGAADRGPGFVHR